MSGFENLRVADNFYQTSSCFPMPAVVITTLCEDGTTTLDPYSLVQPYYVAAKEMQIINDKREKEKRKK